jgi:hypothetical protein
MSKRTHVSPYVKIDHLLMSHPAFKTLTGNAVKLLLYIRQRFNGANNGQISYSVREAAELLRCSKDTAGRAFQELVEHRLLAPTSKGAFHVKVRHATTWRITFEHTNGHGATNEYAHWKVPDDGPPTRTDDADQNLEIGPSGRTVGPCGRTVRSDNVTEFPVHGTATRTVRW